MKINPGDAEAWYQRGRLLLEVSRYEEAAVDLTQALSIEPGHAEARLASCFAELPVIYKNEAEIDQRRAAYEQKLRALAEDVERGALKGDLIKAVGARNPFLLAYQGENDRVLQQIYGDIISRIIAQRFSPPPLPPPPAPGEVIPCRHRQQLFLPPFQLENFDQGMGRPARPEVFSHHRLSPWRHPRRADRSRLPPVRPLRPPRAGYKRLAVQILANAPHVLIYPGLLMDISSIQLAAQRLARVQCNSWGHPETSGLPTMDYFLSSDLMDPPDADAFYTEKLVRLPNLSIYYEPGDTKSVEVTREELGLRPGATVFWSGQSLFKYLPQYDDAFVQIAREVGDCQFVFLRHFGAPKITAIIRERLERAFAAAGMRADDYCVFLNRLSQSKFVAAAGLSDVPGQHRLVGMQLGVGMPCPRFCQITLSRCRFPI